MPENLWPVKCPQLPEVCDHHPFILTDDPAYFRRAGGPSIDIQEDVEETDTSLTINED